jgi:D-3-phosphoglycerate dehydrogenase
VKVLVRERISDAGLELLRGKFDVDVDSDGDLADKIADYDAIIIRSGTHLTKDLIERAERLKVIGRAGVGVDNVDVEAASRRGIVVANAPESTVVSASEHTIGLLLALSRSIPQAHASLKAGKWDRSRFGGLELAGKTLGLVGFGRIGQQVARRARALEMDVVAFDPYVAAGRFRELGVEQAASLESLLERSDFLSLHLTLAPETYRLIGHDQLAAAKDGIRIVNAARGELIDEAALVEALQSGKVRSRERRSTSSRPSLIRARCSSSTTSS